MGFTLGGLVAVLISALGTHRRMARPPAKLPPRHPIGQELRAVGIDSNCAPTLDVAQDRTHPFLRKRCLGTDPDRVAELGRAAADGLLAAGVLPVVKHMPGHGRA